MREMGEGDECLVGEVKRKGVRGWWGKKGKKKKIKRMVYVGGEEKKKEK